MARYDGVMAKNEENGLFDMRDVLGLMCIIATKYLRDVVVVITLLIAVWAIIIALFVSLRLFGQINNAFHHSCFDSFFPTTCSAAVA